MKQRLQKIIRSPFALLAVVGMVFVVSMVPAPVASAASCGDVKTFFNFGSACSGANSKAADQSNPIITLALGILNIMAFGVSLVVAGGIVYGGILYASARDNSGQVQQATTIIVNSVIALVTFFFLWAFVNFIVPGGLF